MRPVLILQQVLIKQADLFFFLDLQNTIGWAQMQALSGLIKFIIN